MQINFILFIIIFVYTFDFFLSVGKAKEQRRTIQVSYQLKEKNKMSFN